MNDVAFEAEFFGGPQDGMVRAFRKESMPGGSMVPPKVIYFSKLAAGEIQRWVTEGDSFDNDSLVTTVQLIYRMGDMMLSNGRVPYEYVGVEGENEQKCVMVSLE